MANKSDLFTIFLLIGITIIIPFGLLALGYIVQSEKCDEYGSLSGKRVNYSGLSGCFIEHKGRMIPVSTWRNNE